MKYDWVSHFSLMQGWNIFSCNKWDVFLPSGVSLIQSMLSRWNMGITFSFKLKGISMNSFETTIFIAAFAMRVSQSKVCFIEVVMPYPITLKEFHILLFLSEFLTAKTNPICWAVWLSCLVTFPSSQRVCFWNTLHLGFSFYVV